MTNTIQIDRWSGKALHQIKLYDQIIELYCFGFDCRIGQLDMKLAHKVRDAKELKIYPSKDSSFYLSVLNDNKRIAKVI